VVGPGNSLLVIAGRRWRQDQLRRGQLQRRRPGLGHRGGCRFRRMRPNSRHPLSGVVAEQMHSFGAGCSGQHLIEGCQWQRVSQGQFKIGSVIHGKPVAARQGQNIALVRRSVDCTKVREGQSFAFVEGRGSDGLAPNLGAGQIRRWQPNGGFAYARPLQSPSLTPKEIGHRPRRRDAGLENARKSGKCRLQRSQYATPRPIRPSLLRAGGRGPPFSRWLETGRTARFQKAIGWRWSQSSRRIWLI
jgi:hypothetical protein